MMQAEVKPDQTPVATDRMPGAPIGQQLIESNPVNTRRLHRYGNNPAISQPLDDGFELPSECAKSSDRLLGAIRRYSHPDFIGTHIDSGRIRLWLV